jgi:hypothetical protein
MTEQTGWLIERRANHTNQPIWYSVLACTEWDWKQAIDPPMLWTTDASKALRFARQTDAEAFIKFKGFQHALATEHMWCDYGD